MVKNKANDLYTQYFLLLLDNNKAIDSAIICAENLIKDPMTNRVFWGKVIKELKTYEREEQSDMPNAGVTL